MIKLITLIEEKPSGDVQISMQAVPFHESTHKEKQYSSIVNKAMEGMCEVILSKSKSGQMVSEDDVAHRVKTGVEDWWNELLRLKGADLP